MAVVLLVLALVWSGFVAALVIGSAPEAGATLIVFDRQIATPGTTGGVWILCALVASAVLALAWAVGAWRRRRHHARVSAEFDRRWELRDHAATAEEARGRLMESRERELDETIHTLTAQRDALLAELAAIRATSPDVVVLPEAPDGRVPEARDGRIPEAPIELDDERETVDRAG